MDQMSWPVKGERFHGESFVGCLIMKGPHVKRHDAKLFALAVSSVSRVIYIFSKHVENFLPMDFG
jgi:hypothetical protein